METRKEKLSLEEQKALIDKIEEYSEEMRKKEEKAIIRSFKEIFEEANRPVTVYVPELNCNIRFKGITVQDLLEIDLITDPVLIGQETLFRMWKNGDSTVSREDFDKLTVEVKDAVLKAIYRKMPFLPLQKPQTPEIEAKGLQGSK